MENNYKNISEIKPISILNKIKAKQILIEKIFPFTYNRPMIIPYIIDKDLILKNSMKNSYKSLKKKNMLSSEINQIFHNFIDFRKKYKENFSQKYLDDFKYIKHQFENFQRNGDLFMLYRHIFNDIFYNNFSQKQLNNFIIDYFQLGKSKNLFMILSCDSDLESNENIDFLSKLTPSIIEKLEINLICCFKEHFHLASSPIQIRHISKINSIYIKIDPDFNLNTFNIMKDFLQNLKCRIKKIIFNQSFNCNYHINNIYIGSNLEILSELYKNESLNLDLDDIEIEGENIYSLYRIIYLKYNLKCIFSKNDMWDLIIITLDQLKSIQKLNEKESKNLKNKLNPFYSSQNNLKTLVIDFKGDSPYQENFIYFCHHFLGYNESFNKIALFNMGKNNFDFNCYKKMNDQKPEIYFSNSEILIIGVIDDNIKNFINKEEIMKFVDLFFYKDRMNYIFKAFYKNHSEYFFINDISELNNPFDKIIEYIDIELENLTLNYSKYFNIVNVKKFKSKDELINEETKQKIIEIYHFLGKKYRNIRIGEDIIKKINYFNMKEKLNSKILTDESQKDFLYKMLNEYIYSIFSLDKVDDNNSNNLNLSKILKRPLEKKHCLLFIVKVEDNNILALLRNLKKRWIVFDVNNKLIDKDRSLFFGEYFLGFENQTLEILDFEIFIIKLEEI